MLRICLTLHLAITVRQQFKPTFMLQMPETWFFFMIAWRAPLQFYPGSINKIVTFEGNMVCYCQKPLKVYSKSKNTSISKFQKRCQLLKIKSLENSDHCFKTSQLRLYQGVKPTPLSSMQLISVKKLNFIYMRKMKPLRSHSIWKILTTSCK